MEHSTPTPPTTPNTVSSSPNDSYVARGLAGASVGLGFFGACVFWWFLSAAFFQRRIPLGVISLARGVKGGLRRKLRPGGDAALCDRPGYWNRAQPGVALHAVGLDALLPVVSSRRHGARPCNRGGMQR